MKLIKKRTYISYIGIYIIIYIYNYIYTCIYQTKHGKTPLLPYKHWVSARQPGPAGGWLRPQLWTASTRWGAQRWSRWPDLGWFFGGVWHLFRWILEIFLRYVFLDLDWMFKVSFFRERVGDFECIKRILNIVLGRMFYRLTHAEIVSTSDWKLSKFIQILNRSKLVRS